MLLLDASATVTSVSEQTSTKQQIERLVSEMRTAGMHYTEATNVFRRQVFWTCCSVMVGTNAEQRKRSASIATRSVACSTILASISKAKPLGAANSFSASRTFISEKAPFFQRKTGLCGDRRAALRCPAWPQATARAARSGLDSTRRAAWHKPGRSPHRFVLHRNPFCCIAEER